MPARLSHVLRRRLADSRVRFGVLCLVLAPVLAGCAGVTLSCGGGSKEDGVIVAKGVPSSAERGATIRVDLAGTQLYGEDNRKCIASIVAAWSDASSKAQVFYPPEKQACGALTDFAIDVVVPTRNAAGLSGTEPPYVGGTLTIQATGRRTVVEPADGRGFAFAGATSYATKEFAITVPAPANAAPTADLFPRYTPMPPADFADYGAEGGAIDARMSRDPEGGALSYAWDLDGDGTYGDDPAGGTGATGLPVGVAIVPPARRQTSGVIEVEVGVRVTDAGGLTGEKRFTVVVSNNLPPTPKIAGLSPTTVTAGGAVTLTFATNGNDYACIDPDGGNPLSTAGRVHSIQNDGTTASYGTTYPITAGAVGPHRVTSTLWFWSGPPPTSCAATDLPAPAFIWSDVYTSVAARKATKQYTARARLVVRGMTPIASDVNVRGEYTNVIARGRYTLRTPAKGGGVKRPAALGLFRGGDVVVSSPSLTTFGGGASERAMGNGTMLLRGTGGVLACVESTATPDRSTYTFVGGTGAARRLTARAIAEAVPLRFPATQPKRAKPQRKPARGGTTIAASTGSSRGLPSACRALIRHLP